MSISKLTPPLSKEWEELRLIYRDSTIGVSEPVKILNGKAVLSEIPDKSSHVKIDGFTEVYLEDIEYLKKTEFTVNYNNGIIYFSEGIADGTYVLCHYKGRGVVLYPSSRIYMHYNKTDNSYTTLDDAYKNLEPLFGLKKEDIVNKVRSVNNKTGDVKIDAVSIGALPQSIFNTFQSNVNSEFVNVSSKIRMLELTINNLTQSEGSKDVLSVNGKIGNVYLDASDVNAVSLSVFNLFKTSTSNDFTSVRDDIRDLRLEVSKIDTSKPEINYPVTSVNGLKGEVLITAFSIGAMSQGTFNVFKEDVDSRIEKLNSDIFSIKESMLNIDFSPLEIKIGNLENRSVTIEKNLSSTTVSLNSYKASNNDAVKALEIRVSNLEGRINGFANHIHDDRYYTKEEILALLGNWGGGSNGGNNDDKDNPFRDGNVITIDGGDGTKASTHIVDGGKFGVLGKILVDGGKFGVVPTPPSDGNIDNGDLLDGGIFTSKSSLIFDGGTFKSTSNSLIDGGTFKK